MIFEDAHWTDPTSLETFGRSVDRIKALPALLIVTFRPEFEPPWIGRLTRPPHDQSAGGARHRGDDRPRRREQGATEDVIADITSARTAFRCSWRK